jgi:hypothetical protein
MYPKRHADWRAIKRLTEPPQHPASITGSELLGRKIDG